MSDEFLDDLIAAHLWALVVLLIAGLAGLCLEAVT